MLSPAPLLSTCDQQRVIARVTWRLIGFAFVCYVVAYIDRVTSASPPPRSNAIST